MATIFLEGFDKYGAAGEENPDPGDLMVQGEWTSHGSVPSWYLAPGLSHTGCCFAYGGGTDSWVAKTLPDTYHRLIGGVRFQWTNVGVFGPIIQFRNGTNAQISFLLEPDGRLTVVQGGFAYGLFGVGDPIATSDVSISQGETHYLEWDITFDNAGSYHLWLDGLSIMADTADTSRDGAPQATGIVIGNNSGMNALGGIALDDLYLFDTTGTTNNAPLLTNPRIETRFPNADVQTQFENSSSLLGVSNSVTDQASDPPGANQLFLRKLTSSVNQTILSVSCIPTETSGSAKFASVLYADNAGSPGALLSAGTEVIGTTAHTALTSNLTTPIALTASTAYWSGFIVNTSVALRRSDSLTLGQKAANTYTSGAPDPAPAMTTTQPDWIVYGNCQGATTNWESVSQNPVAGDLSSIQSSSPGDQDLYSVPILAADEADIYSIAVKASFKRSDSGPRTVDLRLKSGAVNSAGSNSGLTSGTSYEWNDTYFDLDPDGDVAWDLISANAIQVGPKIAT